MEQHRKILPSQNSSEESAKGGRRELYEHEEYIDLAVLYNNAFYTG